MSATIKYKGNTIATASNNTKTLLTAGKYMEANVVVTDNGGGGSPTLQTKSVTYTPSASQQTDTITPDVGYDGLDEVDVTVNAVSAGSATTPATTITANPTISISGNSVSASVSKTQSVTPTVSAGYIDTGTAGTVSVSGSGSATIPNASTPIVEYVGIGNDGTLTVDIDIDNGGYIGNGTTRLTDSASVPVQAAQTIYPSTSDQSIASGKYLTGAQTIKGVTYSGLDASNIKKDVVVKIGDSADDDRILSVTGTYEGGGGGISLNDIFSRQITGDIVINITPETFSSSIMSDFYGFFRKSKITSIKSTGLAWIPPHFVNMDGTTNNLTNRPLISVEMDAQYCGAQAFKYCSNLATVKLYDLEYGYFNYTGISSSTFEGCTSLTTVAFPKLTRIEATFMKGCTSLTAVDFGALATISGQNHFQNCSAMNVLIIRTSSVATLANINTFANTPFASGKAGGTLYVPNSLISSYQSASNWSTILGYATNSIQKIEGSYYETHYADGTVIS